MSPTTCLPNEPRTRVTAPRMGQGCLWSFLSHSDVFSVGCREDEPLGLVEADMAALDGEAENSEPEAAASIQSEADGLLDKGGLHVKALKHEAEVRRRNPP